MNNFGKIVETVTKRRSIKTTVLKKLYKIHRKISGTPINVFS